MTQITINIENTKILPHLKKILSAIEGVSIVNTPKKRKVGIEEAIDDIKAGNITRYGSPENLFKAFEI